MSKNYEGIFLFTEWLDALNRLQPKTAMTVINHFYRIQLDGTEPPAMRGSAETIQSIMIAHARWRPLGAPVPCEGCRQPSPSPSFGKVRDLGAPLRSRLSVRRRPRPFSLTVTAASAAFCRACGHLSDSEFPRDQPHSGGNGARTVRGVAKGEISPLW